MFYSYIELVYLAEKQVQYMNKTHYAAAVSTSAVNPAYTATFPRPTYESSFWTSDEVYEQKKKVLPYSLPSVGPRDCTYSQLAGDFKPSTWR